MILRDAHGIPHVRGSSVLEVAYEQGRACALDRAWQLELERRRGEGTTAELLGASGVEWDVLARRALIPEIARRALAGLDRRSQLFVGAYVEGVNAVLLAPALPVPSELQALDARPGRWQPWTPLAVFLVQHLLFGTFPSQLWRRHVRAVAGEEAAAMFRLESVPSGSNAFGVAGALTGSNRPLIAGDPHRLLEDPGIYAQVRLRCDDPDDLFDVAGLSFPGVPGVQHFGQTFAGPGGAAWAVTNAMADYQDLREEHLLREGAEVLSRQGDQLVPVARRVERIGVRDGDDVTCEVLVTSHGPVVAGGPEHPVGALSLRTPSYVLGDLGFGALLPLLRARTAEDVESALARWVEPVNNVVVADSTGALRHRVVGRVPERDAGGGWTGWVEDLPRLPVRAGRVVTANQRGEGYEVLADEFAPRFRADRLSALLEPFTTARRLTPAEAGRLLTDTHQSAGRGLLDLVADLSSATGPAAQARSELLGWDRRMDADSTGAGRYATFRARVVELIAGSPRLAPLADPTAQPYGSLYAPWFDVRGRIAASLHVLVEHGKPFGLDLAALVEQALGEAAGAPPAPGEQPAPGERPTWGSRHLLWPLHGLEQLDLPVPSTCAAPAPLPIGGDTDCVLAARWLPAAPVTVHGPAARYVWDLSGEDSRWVVPLGASGRRDSPHHHDQRHAYLDGRLVPVVRDWSQLTPDPSEQPARCAGDPEETR